MPVKIPEHKLVERTIQEKVRMLNYSSQQELAAAVVRELQEMDSSYRLSPHRTRMVALAADGVEVRVEVRRGRLPKQCPSCAARLKKIYLRNLVGKKVLYKIRCTECTYQGSENKCAPKHYSFVWKE